MGLREYVSKRDFERTPEPRGRVTRAEGRSFVIQKHAASRLHYDFRIEMDGVMRSWAVPKGPSLDPSQKRLAVHVEDHPIEYSGFEGIIPKGEYGGGTVLVWDRGTWEPEGDPEKGYAKGKLTFRLDGEKVSGTWTLFRMGGARNGSDAKNWMLVKRRDEAARKGRAADVTASRPESVLSGRGIDEVKRDPNREWSAGVERPVPSGGKTTKAGGRRAPRAADAPPTAAGRPSATELARLPGVQRGTLPRTVQPQLCTLVTEVPRGDEWIHEIKFDGYRIMCRVEGRNVLLFSRNGKDWTRRMDPVASAAARLGVKEALLDGEVVVQGKDGVTSFQDLQVALGSGELDALQYHAFDILHLDGWDLRGVPLIRRKEILACLLKDVPAPFSHVDHVEGQGEAFRVQACHMGLEGVVSKRADKPYRHRRTPEWLKIRCGLRQELVIVGFTQPAGSRKHLGALLMGYHDDQGLRYAGRVGTGFTDRALADLRRRLDGLATPRTALLDPPRGADARGVTWIRPELVADVEFTAWTREGRLRHPSFEGLREDKPARDVHREHPAPLPAEARPSGARNAAAGHGQKPTPRRASRKAAQAKPERRAGGAAKPKPRPATRKAAPSKGRPAGKVRAARKGEEVVLGVRITNPDRVLYPENGVTKIDVAQYLAHVADWMLPHLKGRLLTLVRCPTGRTGQCFYQKHLAPHVGDEVLRFDVPGKKGKGEYAHVQDAAGLVALAQSGVLEFHAWGSRVPDLEHPDLVVIDLDPAPDVEWSSVVEAARLVREALQARGLESFVRTTGGKGLHVCFPIVPEHDFDTVKAFSKGLVEEMAAKRPREFLTTMSKAARKGRIFLDYLRNGRGATAVASYSPRAREGATVAVPLRWDELGPALDPGRYTVRSVPRRLARLAEDPWAGYFTLEQHLPAG